MIQTFQRKDWVLQRPTHATRYVFNLTGLAPAPTVALQYNHGLTTQLIPNARGSGRSRCYHLPTQPPSPHPWQSRTLWAYSKRRVLGRGIRLIPRQEMPSNRRLPAMLDSDDGPQRQRVSADGHSEASMTLEPAPRPSGLLARAH